jgi:hypothetical protein
MDLHWLGEPLDGHGAERSHRDEAPYEV